MKTPMNRINRRSFLRQSALAGASLSLWPAISKAQGSASGDIRAAVVGFNGRGRSHIGDLRELKGVRLVALCDVDQTVLDKGVKELKGRDIEVKGYQDVRRLIDNKEIDVVSFATPNHWHALGTIWAVQAGKDVYVEKPLAHNVWEGRKVVEAARKYGRMVQTGSQCRSSQGLIQAIAWLQAGGLGKIIRARGLCYKRRASIGKADKPLDIPPTIDYDLWCGPAPKEPMMRKRLHYDWHWVWPTGNGDLGNQGVHQVDIARWVLGEKTIAPVAFSIGGRLGYEDDGTTPNTQIIYQGYARAPLLFEVRGLPEKEGSSRMDDYRGARRNGNNCIGVVVDCEGGYLVIPSYSEAIAHDKGGKVIKEFKGGGNHFENFITAVRSRSHTDLTADAEDGHLSAALCHTANVSYRLGKKMSPDEIRDTIKNNSDMAEAFGRMEQHLAANSVDLNKTPATLGEMLKFDVKAERCTSNANVNEWLTRNYRKPFVVPEKV